jgi:general stress protein CsbA
MISKPIITRIIVIVFMILVGYSLAKGIYTQSITAILLSLTSLGAGVYFLYLMLKAKEEESL